MTVNLFFFKTRDITIHEISYILFKANPEDITVNVNGFLTDY